MKILESASKIAMLSVVFWMMAMTAFWIEITEPMKTISLMIVSFYFGKTNTDNSIPNIK